MNYRQLVDSFSQELKAIEEKLSPANKQKLEHLKENPGEAGVATPDTKKDGVMILHDMRCICGLMYAIDQYTRLFEQGLYAASAKVIDWQYFKDNTLKVDNILMDATARQVFMAWRNLALASKDVESWPGIFYYPQDYEAGYLHKKDFPLRAENLEKALELADSELSEQPSKKARVG